MERIQLVLILSLVFVSIIMWIIAAQQYDTMMSTMMMFQDPLSLSIFTVIWTAGMAAMMFPAISPMILLYDRLIKTNNTSGSELATSTPKIKRGKESSLAFDKDALERREEKKQKKELLPRSFWSPYTLKMLLFVGSYLAVWAVTGIALLLGWSIIMSFIFTESVKGTQNLIGVIFGLLLVISGLYQFSPLKTKCLGYCESPLSFFMRRWRRGIGGAFTMGTYHGLYCLGCCWPYFLLMVALGWMNVLWMGVFAAIIFGEKVWIRGGRWVARGTGVSFLILGALSIFGIIEIPTGDMTMADTTRNIKDMGMKNGMDQEMGTNFGGAKNDMQMNMDMNNNVVMNKNRS
jgi:predicted metal-binding membrane protein